MKIKRIVSSIIVCILLLLGTQVNAAVEATVKAECKEKAKSGDEISVDLKVDVSSAGQGVEGIVGEIEYPSDVLTMLTPESSEVTMMDGMLMVALDKPIRQGEKTITIKFIVKNNITAKEATIKFKDLILVDADQTTKEAGTIEKKIKINEEENANEKTLSKIEIEKGPIRTVYSVGEKFDKTGMKIVAKYTDGSSKEVTDYTYTPAGNLKATDKKVTISYTEGEVTKTVELDITLIGEGEGEGQQEERVLTKIEITTKPSKTTYKAGEKFDSTGMIVTAKYTDETSKKVTGYTYSPSASLKVTDKKVTISYTEKGVTKTATIDITVKDGTVYNGNHKAAGLETIIIPIAVIGIFAIVGFIGYKKYNKI